MLRQRAFTLVELMVVVAIVAILASIAVPSYQQHVRKSARTVAMADLEAIAAAMARYRSQNFTYAGATLGSGGVFPRNTSPDGPASSAKYNLSFSVLTATTFTVQAVRRGAQASDECGTLTLTHQGVRGAGKTGCW